ncbi:hypothetical protein [Allonocardiopsis opalescens]|uniref:IPT/TIG domain-containing protein n=1 Tax=Allonocardiopsis opalescens TaxID=1144618 RepID=A0A2T0QA16_9ACTN|nr:hypothetical protein [Allonocardiopsis opalescens]PRY00652.1 hypothetical protein CLV72_102283 [Allonocardiopsis opalescens]
MISPDPSDRSDKGVLIAIITAAATILAAALTGAAGIATGYLSVSTTPSAGSDQPRPVATVTVTVSALPAATLGAGAGTSPDGLATPPAAEPEPRIYAAPDQGVEGGVVTITGENFEPDERIELSWCTGDTLRTLDADSTGSFETEITIPDSLSCDVTARGTESDRTTFFINVVNE